MIVVVGGQTRNSGKTTLICEIVEGTPDIPWVAVKISKHSHPEKGPATHKNDTARFLNAGAREAHLLSSPSAVEIQQFLVSRSASGIPLIIESNSVLDVLVPDLYLILVDAGRDDVKESVRRYVSRSDGLVSYFSPERPLWCGQKAMMSPAEAIGLVRERQSDLDRKKTLNHGDL